MICLTLVRVPALISQASVSVSPAICDLAEYAALFRSSFA